MSIITDTITLQPVKTVANGAEHFKRSGYTCPSCNGEGSSKHSKGYHGSAKDEIEETICSQCEGFGRLCADVVIRWAPYKPI